MSRLPRRGNCTRKAWLTKRPPITPPWLASEPGGGGLVGDEAGKIPATTMARATLQVKFLRTIAHQCHEPRYLVSLAHYQAQAAR